MYLRGLKTLFPIIKVRPRERVVLISGNFPESMLIMTLNKINGGEERMDYTEKKLRTVQRLPWNRREHRRGRVELPNGVSAFREVVSHPAAWPFWRWTAEKNVSVSGSTATASGTICWRSPPASWGTGGTPFQCPCGSWERRRASPPDLQPLGSIYPSPGYSREVLHCIWRRTSTMASPTRIRTSFWMCCASPLRD